LEDIRYYMRAELLSGFFLYILCQLLNPGHVCDH